MRKLVFIAALAAAAVARGSDSPVGVEETVMPFFPATAEILGFVEGRATVIVAVNRYGVLTDALAVDCSHPSFGVVAADTVRRWKFSPAIRGGRAVDATREVRFTFGREGTVVVTQTIDEHIASRMMSMLRDPYRVRAFTLGEVDRMPRPIAMETPPYPPALRGSGMRGRAVLHYYIDEDGRVRVPDVSMMTSLEFGEAAVHAARTWRFVPGQRRGRPVVTEVSQTVVFGAPGPKSE